MLLPVPNKPIVSIRLVFRTGSVDDPSGKEGLTALTTRVLLEGGTKTLDSAQLLTAMGGGWWDWRNQTTAQTKGKPVAVAERTRAQKH